jgi:hypothetical protein
VATAGAGLDPAVRAELLTVLAADADPVVKEKACNALLSIPQEVLLEAAKVQGAPPALLEYVAENVKDRAAVAAALAANASCPGSALAKVAEHLAPAAVQALVDNLERLADSPELIAALRDRPDLTLEQKRAFEELTKETDRESLMKSLEEGDPEPERRKTLTQRLAGMNVIERLTLALKGGKEERMALIRDPNKLVQRAVLQSPRLADLEVETFASMTNVTEEVLRHIALNRNFMKNYSVVRNLLNNPKTPVDISLHFLQRLVTTDQKKLSMNKNVPETVRSMVIKILRQKAVKGET